MVGHDDRACPWVRAGALLYKRISKRIFAAIVIAASKILEATLRVLFYGGCHATALRDIFLNYVSDDIEAEVMTNFQMISKNIPFPYGKVGSYDAVIFSPINREGPYNTGNLLETCREKGVKAISYPWIEWRGYWPGATKSNTGWGNLWSSHLLPDLARQSKTLQEFEDRTYDAASLGQIAEKNIEMAISALRQREMKSGVDFPVTDFIADNYRKSRLMLTPDHASNELYGYLVPKIAEGLGLRLDRSFAHLGRDIQHGILIPILPAVADHLGLSFRCGDFLHQDFIGPDPLPFRDYLKLHFYGETISRYVAETNTRIIEDGGAVRLVTKGQRFVGRHLGRASPHVLVDILGGTAKARGQARIFLSHWSTLPFRAPQPPDA